VVWPAGGLALAAAGSRSATATPPLRELKLNASSVAAFADRELPAALHAGKIPGAVFVVVRGDQVLCAKAYGVADLKTGRPVSVEQTLFRAASISKILTAAAALQLVHAHKLRLHQDVNDYLKHFHIAPAFGAPVTLFNLLTHSSGFDECQFGYAARTAAEKLSLRDYLTRFQPARVRPPGLFSVYDNYGFTLAGYLVQRAAGVPFADYVRRQLLAPLDMDHSSFSPGTRLRQRLATGYWLDAGTPRPYRQHYINITPAAGLCTTAADMSDFLVALLADRRPDGAKMFPAGILQELQTAQFVARPDVSERCYGFNQITLAGRSALRQPGQWPGFNSLLLLFPQKKCGLFLAYNLCDYERLDHRLSRQFAETFIPPDAPALAPEAAPPAGATPSDLAALAGCYLSSRSAHESPALNFPREIEVSPGPAGSLEINGQCYRELAPLEFAKGETHDSPAGGAGPRLAFYQAGDGEITHLITESGTYRRASWLEGRQGRRFLLSLVTAVFVSAILLWPLLFLLRQISSGPNPQPASHLARAACGMALAACGLALWFEAAFALAESRLQPFADFYGLPPSIHALLWALPVLLALTIGLAVFGVVAWCRRWWHPVQRVHYTLVTAACALFLYFFFSRHLLFAG
jgi:CubicO group peptidase (beta-lactamase class C family)